MPMNTLQLTPIDISAYPTEIKSLDDSKIMTIGDLHGNFLLFFHFLVHYGIVACSEQTYDALADIFYRADGNLVEEEEEEEEASFSAEDWKDFRKQMALCSVPKDKNIHLIVLGDMLADRRGNDVLMLYLFFFLDAHKVTFEIILSNHDFDFIRYAEMHIFESIEKFRGHLAFKRLQSPLIGKKFILSFTNLRDFIEDNLNDIFFTKEVLAFCQYVFKEVYLPQLKLMAFVLSDTGNAINVYTHAPIEFDAVAVLAEYLNTSYQDDSPKALATSIDTINEAFQKQFAATGKISKKYLVELPAHEGNPYKSTTEIAAYFLWNRKSRDSNVTWTPPKGFAANNVHGHDSTSSLKEASPFVFNLDGQCGKHPDTDKSSIDHQESNTRLKVLLTDKPSEKKLVHHPESQRFFSSESDTVTLRPIKTQKQEKMQDEPHLQVTPKLK